MSKIILPHKTWVGRYNAQLNIKDRTVSNERTVTQFEIELPIEEGGVSYIDDETHRISPNTIICAKPGQTRHTRLPFKCYFIHLVVHEGMLYDILSGLPNFIETANTERIRNLFERLCACHVSEDPSNELLRQSLILEIIYSINNPPLSHKSNKAIEKVVLYIKNNISTNLTLESVASEVKFAPSYFHKIFKEHTGKPLRRYIEELRIEKASNLLVTTDMTLTEIAYECGFSSQSYFSYAFKRHTAMTPRSYAKNMMGRYNKTR